MSNAFDELAQACRVLFGERAPVCRAFIDYLQPAGLKAAYRSLALNTHPDRAAVLEADRDILAEQFHSVHRAYRLLLPYVCGEEPVPPLEPTPLHPRSRAGGSAAHGRRRTARTNRRRAFYYAGRVPAWELRFGQFLYYRRCIPWDALIQALVWQRRQRPLLGALACDRGWLAKADLARIRAHGRPGEFWGEAAMRLGLLTRTQVHRLLGVQRLSGHPIGRFFVEQALLTAAQRDRLLAAQRQHNLKARVERRRARGAAV